MHPTASTLSRWLPVCALLCGAPALAQAPSTPVKPSPVVAARSVPLPSALPPVPPAPARRAGVAARAAAPPEAPLPLPAPAPPDPSSPGTPPDPRKGNVTNLPIPRFAALKTDEVNLRTGPGQRYPVDWVFKRRGLPVQIEREFDVWRLVRDPEGVKGWVHQATLTGRRTFMVVGAERAMRRQASDDAAIAARLKPGVVGRLLFCEAAGDWCRVQVGEYRGWLKRSDFWGVLPGEAVN